jgi:glycogen(starch) synthase
MRVLMFGWEFPPVVSGGLGVATEGLVRGLLENDAEVVLVLPRPGTNIPGSKLRIVTPSLYRRRLRSPGSRREAVEIRRIASPLRPYLTAERYRDASKKANGRKGRRDGAGSPSRGPYGVDLRAEVVRYAEAGAEIARRERFDVIHAHDWLTFLAGLAARRVSGRPLAVHVHATEVDRAGEHGDPFVATVERLGLEEADRVIAVSAYTADLVRKAYGIPAGRIRVVHNAIDAVDAEATDTRAIDAAHTGRPANGHAPVVLFAGRVTWQKGPEHFVDAAALVARELPEARFVVAGSGDRLALTAERAATLGVADRFEFTGFLDRAALDRLYDEADVYVMPSVSEPFGLTALEALRRGTPVILSRRAGVSEIVPDVLRVDFDDPRELASKILSVLLFRPLSGALSRRGREDVSRLSWKQSAAACLDVYREMRR